MHASYRAYEKTSVESISREDLLLKLYEGAILRIKEARNLYEKGEKTRARELRSQAMSIIAELDNTLDRENGEKSIVEDLEALYGFMLRRINDSVMSDDFSLLEDVEEILTKLYEGFKEAANQIKRQ